MTEPGDAAEASDSTPPFIEKIKAQAGAFLEHHKPVLERLLIELEQQTVASAQAKAEADTRHITDKKLRDEACHAAAHRYLKKGWDVSLEDDSKLSDRALLKDGYYRMKNWRDRGEVLPAAIRDFYLLLNIQCGRLERDNNNAFSATDSITEKVDSTSAPQTRAVNRQDVRHFAHVKARGPIRPAGKLVGASMEEELTALRAARDDLAQLMQLAGIAVPVNQGVAPESKAD